MKSFRPIPVGAAIEPKVFDQEWDFLGALTKRQDDTSQFGESTLLAAIVEKIAERNLVSCLRSYWCFECGAGEPEWCSNTKMFRDQQWSSVLIDKDPENVKRLRSRAGPWSIVIEADATDLDQILGAVGCPWCRSQFPLHADLGIIDVDGQDWWLWDRMRDYQPRVMMVEVCPHDDASPAPPEGGKGQAGELAIVELGRLKGYKPLCRTTCNVIFGWAPLL